MDPLIPELEQKHAPIVIGCDIGQKSDPTAFVVCECLQKHTGRWREGEHIRTSLEEVERFARAKAIYATHYHAHSLQRLPLGTPYPEVARRLTDILCNPRFEGRHVRVLLDITGVGKPVFDTLAQEASNRQASRDAELVPITFVAGEKFNRSNGSLGKAYLVSRLQSLLQSGRVHLPATSEARATVEELKVYEIKIDQDGKDTYGAFKVGKHDDLATSLGLAVLDDPFAGAIEIDEELSMELRNYRGW